MQMQMRLDREERCEECRKEHCKNHQQQAEWTGFVASLVGGIAVAFGVEPPAPKKAKRSICDDNNGNKSDGSDQIMN